MPRSTMCVRNVHTRDLGRLAQICGIKCHKCAIAVANIRVGEASANPLMDCRDRLGHNSLFCAFSIKLVDDLVDSVSMLHSATSTIEAFCFGGDYNHCLGHLHTGFL